jgi:signal transduction histidine kinase
MVLTRCDAVFDDILIHVEFGDDELPQHHMFAIACEVVASERVIAEARGARVELVARDPLIARIDASKLRQILQNLVRSAIDAVATDGRIAVTIRGDAENVYLRVEGDGRGIPDAIQQRIYDPFFSTKQSGTGLGMSIVHSMVMLHGGTIDVRSSPNGTRFEVAIPRRP